MFKCKSNIGIVEHLNFYVSDFPFRFYQLDSYELPYLTTKLKLHQKKIKIKTVEKRA